MLCSQPRGFSHYVAAGGEPCDALCDVAARRLGTEEVGSFVGYSLVGPVAECSVDDRVPSSATIRISGPLSQRVSDPLGRLVGKGGESVRMSVASLTVRFQVIGEKFASVTVGGWRQSEAHVPCQGLPVLQQSGQGLR